MQKKAVFNKRKPSFFVEKYYNDYVTYLNKEKLDGNLLFSSIKALAL